MMIESEIRLKDLSQEELQELVAASGWKRFHGRQIFAAIHKRLISNFKEMTDLPLPMRRDFRKFEPLDLAEIERVQEAQDGTLKALLRLRDASFIESVWIPEETHATQCLSTQVGCPLKCTFCATGLMGYRRNLSVGEICEQVIQMKKVRSDPPLRNLVFMGMGEPLLNYDNLVKAIRILSHSNGSALSQRRMTVSTAGIVPGITKLADEGLKVKLAVSLNAPTDDLRDTLMPVNRKYPIAEVMKAVRYFQKRNGQRITFEYTLMPGINDTPPLIRLLRDLLVTVPCKLNLIPINPVEPKNPGDTDWDAVFDRFYKAFEKERITLTLRRSRGSEIRAACGQLATSATGKTGKM